MTTVQWEWLLVQAEDRGFDWDGQGGCFRHRSTRRPPMRVHEMLEAVDPERFARNGDGLLHRVA